MSEFEQRIAKQKAAAETERKRKELERQQAIQIQESEIAKRNEERETDPYYRELLIRVNDPRIEDALRACWERFAATETKTTVVKSLFRKKETITTQKHPFAIEYCHQVYGPPYPTPTSSWRDHTSKYEVCINVNYGGDSERTSGISILIQYRDVPRKMYRKPYSPDYGPHSRGVGGNDLSGKNREVGFSYEVRGHGKQDGSNVFYSLEDLLNYIAKYLTEDKELVSWVYELPIEHG